MDNKTIAKSILQALGMPPQQQSQICTLALLAMINLKPEDSWSDSSNPWIRIHDIILFIREYYGITYAENSRETFRKQAIHPFRTAALIEDNGKATNSPNYRYRITPEFLAVLQGIGNGPNALEKAAPSIGQFIDRHSSLSELYASKKKMQMMPIKVNTETLHFSPGKHNLLQKHIIEHFAPRFAHNSECLYVGDTIKKDLVKNEDKLSQLGFEITLHDKMPDVVLYCEEKNWIFFIEAVTSVGPMSYKRILEIEAMTQNVKSGKVYITAFLDFATFKKFSDQLAWETEVWIADMPDHMIHLNGDRFLGPR
ncbi:BsuBI/PstI family type II restriction endonuclease [Porphyromonas catoniae]